MTNKTQNKQNLETYLNNLAKLSKTHSLLDMLNEKNDELADIIKSECKAKIGVGFYTDSYDMENHVTTSYSSRSVINLECKKDNAKTGFIAKYKEKKEGSYMAEQIKLCISYGKAYFEYVTYDKNAGAAIDALKDKLIGETKDFPVL